MPATPSSGVLGQLAVTLPAALLVLRATALELAASAWSSRAPRGARPSTPSPRRSIAAMVAAVLEGHAAPRHARAFGLFRAPDPDRDRRPDRRWPPGGSPPFARVVQPLTAFRSWRETIASVGSSPVAALVAVVWAGPVLLQLASPVVPFIDVLPNYVGPVEHLRTFGWFSPLSETQSPIIGPIRTVLGYDGLLGALATMTEPVRRRSRSPDSSCPRPSSSRRASIGSRPRSAAATPARGRGSCSPSR